MASRGDKVGIHILSIGLAAKESILLSFCLWGRNSKVLPPMKNETSLDTEPVTAWIVDFRLLEPHKLPS